MPPKNKNKNKNKAKNQADSTPTASTPISSAQENVEGDFSKQVGSEKEIQDATPILDENKLKKFSAVFEKIDLDKSGKVSRKEFTEILDKYKVGLHWDQDQLEQVFDGIDEDKDGRISREEFINALNQESPNKNLFTIVDAIIHEENVAIVEEHKSEEKDKKHEEEERKREERRQEEEQKYNELGPERYATEYLRIDAARFKQYKTAFELIDVDDNTFITEKEFDRILDKNSLGNNLSKPEVQAIFHDLDKDRDDKVDLKDFLDSLHSDHANKSLLGIIDQLNVRKKELKLQKEARKNVGEKKAEEKAQKEAVKAYALETLKMSEEEFKRYQNVFMMMNLNESKTIELEEFKKCVKIYTEEKREDKISKAFTEAAKGDKEGITLKSFLESVHDKKEGLLAHIVNDIIGELNTVAKMRNEEGFELKYASEVLKMSPEKIAKCQKAFNILDLDKNKTIDKAELSDMIKSFSLLPSVTDEKISSMFKQIDKNKSGTISLFEFFQSLGGLHKNEKLVSIVDAVILKEKEIADYAKKRGVKSPPAKSISPKKSNSPTKIGESIEPVSTFSEEVQGETEGVKRAVRAGNKEEGSQQKIEELEKRLTEVEEENKKLVEENNELKRSQEAGANEENQRLQGEVDNLKKDIERFTEELKGYETQRKEVERLTEEIQKLQSVESSKAALDEELEKLREQCKTFEAEKDEQRKRVEELEKQQGEKDEEYQRLQEMIQSKQADIDRLIAEVETKVAAEEVEKLKGELRRLEEVESSKTTLEEELNKLKEQLGENQRLEDLLKSKDAELEEIKKEVERLTSELGEKVSSEDYENQKREVERLNEEIQKFQTVEASKNALEEELYKMKEEKERLNEELKNKVSSEEVEKLNEEIKNLKEGQDAHASLQEELNKLKEEQEKKIQEKEEEIQRLTGELETKVSSEELEAQKKEVEKLTEENQKLKEGQDVNAGLQEELNKLKTLNQELEAQNGEKQKEIDRLAEELKTKVPSEELEAQKKEVEKLTEENQKLKEGQDANAGLQEELNKLKEEQEKKIQEKEQEIERLAEELKTKVPSEDLETQKKEVERLNEEIKNLKEGQDVNAGLQDELDKLKALKEEQDKRVQGLESQKEEHEKEIQDQLQKMGDLTKHLGEKETEVDGLNKKVETLTEQLKNKESNEGDQETQKKETEEKLKGVEDEKAALEEELRKLKEENKTLQEEKEAQEKKIQDLEKAIEAKEGELEGPAEQIKALTEQLNSRVPVEDLEAQKKEVEKLKEEIEKLNDIQDSKEALETELNELKEKYQTLETESKEKEGKIKALEEKAQEVDVLKAEVERLKSESVPEDRVPKEELEAQKEEVAKLNEEIQRLKQDQENAKGDLQEALDKLKAKIQDLEKEKEQNEKEIEKLTEELKTRVSSEELEAQKKEAENLAEELKNKTSEINTKDEELQKVKEETQEANDKLAALETEKSELKAKLEEAQKAISDRGAQSLQSVVPQSPQNFAISPSAGGVQQQPAYLKFTSQGSLVEHHEHGEGKDEIIEPQTTIHQNAAHIEAFHQGDEEEGEEVKTVPIEVYIELYHEKEQFKELTEELEAELMAIRALLEESTKQMEGLSPLLKGGQTFAAEAAENMSPTSSNFTATQIYDESIRADDEESKTDIQQDPKSLVDELRSVKESEKKLKNDLQKITGHIRNSSFKIFQGSDAKARHRSAKSACITLRRSSERFEPLSGFKNLSQISQIEEETLAHDPTTKEKIKFLTNFLNKYVEEEQGVQKESQDDSGKQTSFLEYLKHASLQEKKEIVAICRDLNLDVIALKKTETSPKHNPYDEDSIQQIASSPVRKPQDIVERTEEAEAFEDAIDKEEVAKKEQEITELQNINETLQKEKEEGLTENQRLKEENQTFKEQLSNLEKIVQDLEEKLKQRPERDQSQEKLSSLAEANGGSNVEFDAENDENAKSQSREQSQYNEAIMQAAQNYAQQNELMITDFVNSLFKKVGIQVNQNHLKNKEQQEELVSKLISALSENIKKNSFEPTNPSRFKPSPSPFKEENQEVQETSKLSIAPRRHVQNIPSSDTVYQVLHFLTTDANFAKRLCRVAQHYEGDRIMKSIRKIIVEIRDLNEKTLRDYKNNKFGNPENSFEFLKYIHNLLGDCSVKQRELRQLQDELLTSFN